VTDDDDGVTFAGMAGRKTVVGGPVPAGVTVRLLVPGHKEPESVFDAITDMSMDLILGAKQGATVTQKRMASTFNSYVRMLWLLFGFGLAAFGVAAARGLTADTTSEVITTGIFAGLSATTFVATFILRPTGSMADAGPRAAWAQAVVTTFWTKLGYMNDPDQALQQLDDAQRSIQRAMLSYLGSSTKAQRAWLKELHPEKSKVTEARGDQDKGGTDESPT
jgi:hypothetical protein